MTVVQTIYHEKCKNLRMDGNVYMFLIHLTTRKAIEKLAAVKAYVVNPPRGVGVGTLHIQWAIINTMDVYGQNVNRICELMHKTQLHYNYLLF